jgi:hypothetical protein
MTPRHCPTRSPKSLVLTSGIWIEGRPLSMWPTMTTRLLLTPMLFAALLAGTPGLDAVPAAVLAAAAAWLTVQARERPAARA